MQYETINTGVKLDKNLHARLKHLSIAKDRTPHWLMKAAIEEYVQREEIYEREKAEDMENWKNYQMTGLGVAHEDMQAWIASWGGENELAPPELKKCCE